MSSNQIVDAFMHVWMAHHDEECAWVDCDIVDPIGLIMTDAGWQPVCVHHWALAPECGIRVWPALPDEVEEAIQAIGESR